MKMVEQIIFTMQMPPELRFGTWMHGMKELQNLVLQVLRYLIKMEESLDNCMGDLLLAKEHRRMDTTIMVV